MLTSLQATKIAREAVSILIERPLEAITGCERGAEGFVFSLEVCETKAHITDNDILATYEFLIDQESGEVLRYARTDRVRRAEAASRAA